MKTAATLALLALLGGNVLAQGLVKFSNSTSTLISYGYEGGPILGPLDPASTYYFALLTAPLGTTDPQAFTFAGIYATNTAATTGGRIQGGVIAGVQVAGWPAGESRAFMVEGWDARLGTTWSPDIYRAWNDTQGYYWGLSPIGQGRAGGIDTNGLTFPAMNVFGSAPSLPGFVLITWIPEPTTGTLTALAAASLLVMRRRQGH